MTTLTLLAMLVTLPSTCSIDGYDCRLITSSPSIAVFHGGWNNFPESLAMRKAANDRYPTRTVADQISIYQGFVDDGLVGLRIAVFTTETIRIENARLTMGDGSVLVCHMCAVDSDTPGKWGSFKLPPRIKKPEVFVVLVPSQFYKSWVTAIEFTGGEK